MCFTVTIPSLLNNSASFLLYYPYSRSLPFAENILSYFSICLELLTLVHILIIHRSKLFYNFRYNFIAFFQPLNVIMERFSHVLYMLKGFESFYLNTPLEKIILGELLYHEK